MKAQHVPSAMRKTGFSALGLYLGTSFIAVLYILLFSQTIWHKEGFGIDHFLENIGSDNGSTLQFLCLSGLFLSFFIWILFGSKVGFYRIPYFIGAPVLPIIFAGVYNSSLFYFNRDNPLYEEPLLYWMAPFVALCILHGVFEKNKAVLDYISPILFTYLVAGVFIIQYWVPDRNFTIAFWMIAVPIIIFYSLNLKMITKEYVKEMPLYRRWFILGKRGESARWGSFYEYFKRDFSGFFAKNRSKIYWSERSKVYYGRTYFEHDTSFSGRHIGSISEQHHITVAGTGGGKSRDAIWNTLLSYAGGVIAFDPKGEHTLVTGKRRAQSRPFHVLDPYKLTKSPYASFWNPLDEIDPKSPHAREQIKTLVSASLYIDRAESANSAHFRENAQMILRGFIAYVLTDPSIDDNKRNLGTVFDLIKTGDPTGERYSAADINLLIQKKMPVNTHINGAARDASDLLMRVSDKEAGSYLSTISRGIDWINSTNVRRIISEKSDFSLRDAKAKEASIYLVLPEDYMAEQSRFVATFFSMALHLCGNTITPQPKNSKRRVLFLFDEFAQLRHFTPAEEKITIARGSYLKFWIILQNMEQLTKVYDRPSDFTGSSDMQFFALKSTDRESIRFINDALGEYTETNGDETHYYDLLPESEIAEFLDAGNDGQIIIPDKGRPLMLRRIPYYKNYPRSQYGNHNY